MPHKTCQKALQLIDQNKLPPTPENYSFWYHYAADTDPALTAAVNEVLAAESRVSAATIKSLRTAAMIGANMDFLKEIADSTGDQLDRLVSLVTAARENAQNYRDGLKAGSKGLAGATGIADKQQLVDRLVTFSAASALKAEQLETQILKSQGEIEALRKQLETAKEESRTDPLTGLPNRKALDRYLDTQAARALADHKPLCAIFCDIDFFKRVNDAWGHAVGDEVLKLVARALDRHCQNIGYAARFGGEEFIIVLPGKALEPASDIAEQILDFIGSQKMKLKATGDILGPITVSMGVAEMTRTETLQSLLERADAALYLAKKTGRNKVCTEIDLQEINEGQAQDASA